MAEANKKILVVVESIDIEDSSGSKANVALIKNLVKAGFDVVVYHYTLKQIELKGIKCIALKENRKSILFFLSRIERQLRFKLNLNLNPYTENLLGFSFTHINDRNSIAKGLKKITDFEPDLILTLSKGASFRPHHALLKIPEWHSKWIAYIHDPYPFASYPRPYDYVEPGHNQKRKFFLSMATKAKYVAYPSKLLAQWMESYYRPLYGKAMIIPHQISQIENGNVNIPDYFKKENFNILHAGNLLWGRDPEGLIEAFRMFLENNPEAKEKAKLIFLGGRNYYSDMLIQVKKGMSQVLVSEDYVHHLQVLTLQLHASVNVILEAKSTISPFLPGKFPHCVLADKPILLLGPYFSESRRLLGMDYPYWSEIDDVHKIAKKIEDLFKIWKENQKFNLNRGDLKDYLSFQNLFNTVNRSL